MPSTLDTLSASEYGFRFRAPLVSSELNKKSAISSPHGVYRGFNIVPGGVDMSVALNADADAGDSVAVVQTLDGYNLNVRRIGASGNLDLTAYASKTVVLALFAEYSATADTFAQIRVYELDPSDEFTGATEHDELVVFGQVVVPASGAIPTSAISPAYRTSSWRGIALEHRPGIPLLRNGSFEGAPSGPLAGFELPCWQMVAAGAAVWQRVAIPNSGAHALSINFTSAAVFTGSAVNYIYAPISGCRLRLRYSYRRLQAVSSGTLALSISFVDESGTPLTPVSIALDTAIASGWHTLEEVFEAPSSAVTVTALVITATGLDLGATGDAFYFDDYQLWAEPLSDAGAIGSVSDIRGVREVIGGVALTAADLTQREGALLGYSGVSGPDVLLTALDGHAVSAGAYPNMVVRGLLKELGRSMIYSDADAEAPRIDFDASTGAGRRILLWESDLSGPGYAVRCYVTNGTYEEFALTVNARWRNATSDWEQDVAAYSSILELDLEGWLRIASKPSSGATWNNSVSGLGWATESNLDANNFLEFLSATAPLAPVKTAAITNRLYANNMVKAWGTVDVTGASPVLLEGFNVASVAYSAGRLQVTLAAGMNSIDELVAVPVAKQANAGPPWYSLSLDNGASSASVLYFNLWLNNTTPTISNVVLTGGVALVDTLSFLVVGTQ